MGEIYSLRRAKFKPKEINGELIFDGYLLKKIKKKLEFPEIDAALLQEGFKNHNLGSWGTCK